MKQQSFHLPPLWGKGISTLITKGIFKVLIYSKRFIVQRVILFMSFVILTLVLPVYGSAQEPVEVDSETKPVKETLSLKPISMSVRAGITVTKIDIVLAPPDLTQVLQEDEARSRENKARRIGIRRQLPTPVTVSAKQSSAGRWTALSNGGSLWMLTIQSSGAEAVRVHIEALSLSEGVQIIVYDPDEPQEAYSLYDRQYLYGQTDLWTESIFAPKVTLEVYVPPEADVSKVNFAIQEIAHIYVKFSFLYNE